MMVEDKGNAKKKKVIGKIIMAKVPQKKNLVSPKGSLPGEERLHQNYITLLTVALIGE